MKTLIIFLLFGISVHSQTLVEKPVHVDSIPKANLKGFEMIKDNAFGNTIIRSKYSEFQPNHIYILVRDGKATLRFCQEYVGSDWIFFDTVVVRIGDDSYTYNVGKTDTKVSTASTVREKSNVGVSQDIFNILNKILQSEKEVTYKLTGSKGAWVKQFSKKDLKYIKATIDLFNNL